MKIPKVPGRGKMTVLAVAVALILVAAPAALAANGGNFILGQLNVATAISKLVGKVAGPSLLINNASEDPKATALQLNVKAGKPPMKVNSDKKVVKLNADKLDNLDQSAFLRSTGKAADSDKLDGKDSTEFYAAGSKVADSAHADNADNATNATNAGNADKLDNLDSAAFGQPIAFGVNNRTYVSITSGDNFILTPAFTPSASGKCLVTVSTQISGSANTSTGPFYRAAIKRGSTASVNDGVFGHYFQPFSGNLSSDMTRSAVVNVTGGEATQFGAYLGSPNTEWQGDQAHVHVTYWCTTPGSGASGASVSTAANAEARAQENNAEN